MSLSYSIVLDKELTFILISTQNRKEIIVYLIESLGTRYKIISIIIVVRVIREIGSVFELFLNYILDVGMR